MFQAIGKIIIAIFIFAAIAGVFIYADGYLPVSNNSEPTPEQSLAELNEAQEILDSGKIADDTSKVETEVPVTFEEETLELDTEVHVTFEGDTAIVYFVKALSPNTGIAILSMTCGPYGIHSSFEYELPQGKEINRNISISGDNMEKTTQEWHLGTNHLSGNHFLRYIVQLI